MGGIVRPFTQINFITTKQLNLFHLLSLGTLSMSKTPPKSQDYESNLTEAADYVVDFDNNKRSFMDKVQHLLHENPALVPLIVLVMSLGVFAILVGNKFFSPFALTLILQQVQIVGVLAAAQSLIILTAGIDLSVGAIAVLCSVVMGQFTFRYGFPAIISIPYWISCWNSYWSCQWMACGKGKTTPFYCYAWDVADRPCCKLYIFSERNNPISRY